MRDLLIFGVILGSLPFALRHTWVAVLLWTWISIMNPHRLAFGFSHYAPVAAIAAGAALLSLVITRDKLRMPWSPPVVVLFLFVVWMCLTTVFAIDPAGSWEQLNKVLTIQLMTAVALMALHERKHIELFIWVNVLPVGYYGFKGGIFTITTGGVSRVWRPPAGFFEDNNAQISRQKKPALIRWFLTKLDKLSKKPTYVVPYYELKTFHKKNKLHQVLINSESDTQPHTQQFAFTIDLPIHNTSIIKQATAIVTPILPLPTVDSTREGNNTTESTGDEESSILTDIKTFFVELREEFEEVFMKNKKLAP